MDPLQLVSEPEREGGEERGGELADIVLGGLFRNMKTLPSKLLYDDQGSQLFEQICDTPEYYLTRTELAIMESCCSDIAVALGRQIMLVEYGSGSSLKTRLLLKHLEEPAAYMPIDISSQSLLASSERIKEEFPGLIVLPLCADFTQPFGTLPPLLGASRTIIYFPGSTIGNLDASEATHLLLRMRRQMKRSGGGLIGFDLRKDPALIEAAYNDAAGLTSRFTLNLLERLNRELSADFKLANFHHRAVYNEKLCRIETHIVSECQQQVNVAGQVIEFARGEEMLVEISCKYSAQDFAGMAAQAGLQVARSWYDEQRWFCLQYLVPA